ncbi:MAG: small multi-drug export protein [Burkholderiales bacterium]|nr:small multi-drug export protein [Anaerolineae bacterium]
MNILPQLVSVFGLAFINLWSAVLLGLALSLSPVLVVITTSLSYTCGVIVVLLLGQPIRDRIMARFGGKLNDNANREGFIWRVWDRFGVIGLGLFAPITVGAQIGAILGLSLNAPPRRLLLWMAIGALLWSIVVIIAASIGILGVQSVTSQAS